MNDLSYRSVCSSIVNVYVGEERLGYVSKISKENKSEKFNDALGQGMKKSVGISQTNWLEIWFSDSNLKFWAGLEDHNYGKKMLNSREDCLKDTYY